MVDQEDRPRAGDELNAMSVGKLVIVLYHNNVIDPEDVRYVFSHLENSDEFLEELLDEQEQAQEDADAEDDD